MLTLGPFFCRSSGPDFSELELLHTGFSIQFTIGTEATELAIYQDTSLWQDGRVRLDSLYVWIERDLWPFAFDCRQFQVKESPGGSFVAIGAFLHGFFVELEPRSDFREVVSDLLSEFKWPVSDALPSDCEASLVPALADRGYKLGWVHQFGVTLHVEFVCTIPLRSGDEFHLKAAVAEFRPKQRRLNRGKWLPPGIRETTTGLAWDEFRSLHRTCPKDALRDADQEATLLEQFTWTNVTLMSVEALAEARKQVIDECPESMTDREVAEALKEQQLYSPSTGISQIQKTVARLRRQ